MTIKTNSSKTPTNQEILPKGLLQDLRHMIDQTRQSIASTEILQDKRAEHEQKIVATVSRQLSWPHFVTFISTKDALSNESLQISYNWSHYDCKRR